MNDQREHVSVAYVEVEDGFTVPWLPELEAAAIARHHRPADRASRFAAHALLRMAIAQRMGVAVREVEIIRMPCLRCGQAHGGLIAIGSGLAVSLSHADGLAIVAITDGREVGVDTEPLRPLHGGRAVLDSVLSRPERVRFAGLKEADRLAAFLGLWVRKEAALKLTGHGLSIDPRLLTIDDTADSQLVQVPGRAAPLWAHRLDLPRTHLGALATSSAFPVTDVQAVPAASLHNAGVAA